jgi:O-antigen ligase
MSRLIVGTCYGAWLFLILLVFYMYKGENENALQVMVLAGSIPAAMQLFLLGFSTRGLSSPVRLAGGLLLAILLSYVSAATDARLAPVTTDGPTVPLQWMPVVFTINTLYIFMLALLVAGCPDRRLMRTAAAVFAILCAPFLLWVVLTGEYLWGRLTAQNIQPNFWGLMGLCVGVAAFAIPSRILAAGCVGVGLLTIYQASARGSLVALIFACLTVGFVAARELRNRKLMLSLSIATSALIGLIVVAPAIPNVERVIMSDVLKIDDPDRGAGQGFTGRDVGWAEAIDLWMNHPLFGVGFRQHEQLLTGISSAHNAYLSMLADTGIVGFLLYVALLGTSLAASLRIRERRSRIFVIALLVGYAVIGFFERRAINSGNPLGVLFLICCFYALAEAQIVSAMAGEDEQSASPTPALSGAV